MNFIIFLRYISSNEAVWRILGFPIHERFPAVVHLSVHLENGQRVYFNESNAFQRISNPHKTTLTSFFQLCQNDSFARTLLYSEVPQYYTLNKSKVFERRKLTLEVDTPIMLLRNINPPILCNGTRLRVKKLLPNIIEATILTGKILFRI